MAASSRRGLAEARTSRMARASTLLETIGNPTLGQIIWGELDEHFVADEDADAVLAHLAGGVAEDLMLVFQFHAEHGLGHQLDDLPAHSQKFVLCLPVFFVSGLKAGRALDRE